MNMNMIFFLAMQMAKTRNNSTGKVFKLWLEYWAKLSNNKILILYICQEYHMLASETMDIVGMKIHPVVCQNSDLHRNSDLQNSQKLVHPLQITAKKIQATMC
jgi:hypothetical protein